MFRRDVGTHRIVEIRAKYVYKGQRRPIGRDIRIWQKFRSSFCQINQSFSVSGRDGLNPTIVTIALETIY